MDTLTSWLLVIIVVLTTLWLVFAYTVWAERRHNMRVQDRDPYYDQWGQELHDQYMDDERTNDE